MTGDPSREWERVWQRLQDYEESMTQQGREYLDLARRLLAANRTLMAIPDLEEEAYQEVESISMLLHSVGEPDEPYLYELIDLITHLLDRLYVRLEYVKWEVSPLSQVPAALAELSQDADLSNEDRELLAFFTAYDQMVRTGRGLADPRTRAKLSRRAAQVSMEARSGAQRRFRALLGQILRLLEYYDELEE